VFVWYASLLFRNTSFAAGGPDESGYMSEAKMLRAGRLRVEIEPLRTLELDRSFADVFTPLGFHNAGTRTMVPSYPPGLPVHLLLASFFGGWERAPYLIAPIMALGCLILTYFVSRELGLPPLFAVAAAAILAAVPQFVLLSLQVMSDVPATFWALLAIWFALRSAAEDKHAFPSALAAGIALGIAFWVRPTNAVLALPIALAMRGRRALVIRAAIGAAPLIVLLLCLNAGVYGNPFRMGYGTPIEVLSLTRFGEALGFYSRWMVRTLTPLVFPLGLLVILDRRADAWHRAMLASWFLSLIVFYGLYGPFDAWWYTRFLLPATPALIIGTLFLIRDLTPATLASVAAIALCAVVIYVSVRFGTRKRVLWIDDDQRVYTGAMQWSAALLPRDAIVVSGVLSGSFLLYQSRFTARWDRLDDDRFQLLRAYAGNAGLKWFAVLSDQEVSMDEFQRHLHGRWTPVSKFRDVTLYRLDD